jgi:hypothetical protein
MPRLFNSIKQLFHGHNVHGFRCRIRNVDAYRHRRCVVRFPAVHVADSSRPYGSDGDCVPRVQSPPPRQGCQATLIASAFTAILLGLSFAFPASATTLYDGPPRGVFYNWTIYSADSGYTSYLPGSGTFSYGTSTALIVSVEACVTGQHDPRTLDVYTDWVTVVDKGTLIGTATVTTACDEDYWGTWQSINIAVNSQFGGEPPKYFYLVQREGYSVPNSQIALSQSAQVIGGITDNTIAPVSDVPFPTSTYTGNFSQYLPSIGYGSDVNRASSTAWTGHLNSMLGTATSTFPLCFVSPLFSLFDSFQGSMATGTSETIIISGGMFPTSTISMEGVNPVLARMGIADYANTIFPVVEGVLWLYFGWVVFTRIFATNDEGE